MYKSQSIYDISIWLRVKWQVFFFRRSFTHTKIGTLRIWMSTPRTAHKITDKKRNSKKKKHNKQTPDDEKYERNQNELVVEIFTFYPDWIMMWWHHKIFSTRNHLEHWTFHMMAGILFHFLEWMRECEHKSRERASADQLNDMWHESFGIIRNNHFHGKALVLREHGVCVCAHEELSRRNHVREREWEKGNGGFGINPKISRLNQSTDYPSVCIGKIFV